MTDRHSRRRRTVLATCAAGVASLAGCGNPLSDDGEDGSPTEEDDAAPGAGADGEGESPTQDDESDGAAGDATTIRLGGETEGWIGVEPEAISDESNPTLLLDADAEYEIVWENLDGEEHELILADGDGEEIEASEESESEGETVSLEFTATEDLAEYFCEYHPDSMRGEIEVTAGE